MTSSEPKRDSGSAAAGPADARRTRLADEQKDGDKDED